MDCHTHAFGLHSAVEFSIPNAAGSGTSVWMVAPGDVSPGHMMLAPCSTNLMAPVSTRSLFCTKKMNN